MEMKQLESFVTACERGSISQAAACMYTTQPNVSKTIRTLEHELGRPLLVRRLSHAQIGVISAPICAFCHHSLGGFSIVFVQPCPLFSDSGSKVGQRL